MRHNPLHSLLINTKYNGNTTSNVFISSTYWQEIIRSYLKELKILVSDYNRSFSLTLVGMMMTSIFENTILKNFNILFLYLNELSENTSRDHALDLLHITYTWLLELFTDLECQWMQQLWTDGTDIQSVSCGNWNLDNYKIKHREKCLWTCVSTAWWFQNGNNFFVLHWFFDSGWTALSPSEKKTY